MKTFAYIVPAQQLRAVIAHLDALCSPDQASTIDVQSQVIAIECVSPIAANHIATRFGDRPGWRRDRNAWLFFEVLEPCVDIEAELHLAQDIVSGCGLSDECRIKECRVVEVGFPPIGTKSEFCAAERSETFPHEAAAFEQISD